MKWLWNRLWLLVLTLLVAAGCSAPSAEKQEAEAANIFPERPESW